MVRRVSARAVLVLGLALALATPAAAFAAPMGGPMPDSYSTPMNTTLVVDEMSEGILANDTHLLGETWVYPWMEAFLYGGLDGTHLTDQGGVITDWDRYAGTFNYTPPENFTGTDSLTYNHWDRDSWWSEYAYDVWTYGISVEIEVTGALPVNYYEQSSLTQRGGTWTTLNRAAASGGSLIYSQSSRAYVDIPFDGTACEIIAARTTSSGKARIYVDDVLTETVDLYRSPNAFQQSVFSVTGLDNGPHTVRIENAGIKNRPSTGFTVMLDAVRITGTLAGGPS